MDSVVGAGAKWAMKKGVKPLFGWPKEEKNEDGSVKKPLLGWHWSRYLFILCTGMGIAGCFMPTNGASWMLPALFLVVECAVSMMLIWNYVSIEHLSQAAAELERNADETKAEVEEEEKNLKAQKAKTDELHGENEQFKKNNETMKKALDMFKGASIKAETIAKKQEAINKETIDIIKERLKIAKSQRQTALAFRLQTMDREEVDVLDAIRDHFVAQDKDKTGQIDKSEFPSLMGAIQTIQFQGKSTLQDSGFPELKYEDFGGDEFDDAETISRYDLLDKFKPFVAEHFKKLKAAESKKAKEQEAKDAEAEKKLLAECGA